MREAVRSVARWAQFLFYSFFLFSLVLDGARRSGSVCNSELPAQFDVAHYAYASDIGQCCAHSRPRSRDEAKEQRRQKQF